MLSERPPTCLPAQAKAYISLPWSRTESFWAHKNQKKENSRLYQGFHLYHKEVLDTHTLFFKKFPFSFSFVKHTIKLNLHHILNLHIYLNLHTVPTVRLGFPHVHDSYIQFYLTLISCPESESEFKSESDRWMDMIDTSIEASPLFPPSSLFPLLDGRNLVHRSSSSSSSSSSDGSSYPRYRGDTLVSLLEMRNRNRNRSSREMSDIIRFIHACLSA